MEEERQLDRVQKIPLTELVSFKDHPFRVVEDESMLRTTESISMFGVLTPLIARPMEDGKYEIVSGHRRAHAHAGCLIPTCVGERYGFAA
jgi:ParB family chromosome partitioning protein